MVTFFSVALPGNLLKSHEFGRWFTNYLIISSHVPQGRGYKNREEARVWANEAGKTKLGMLEDMLFND